MNNLYLSPEAQDDLSEIKAYIAEDLENPQAALSTVTKITKTIRMLQEHALIGVPLSAIADVNSDYRYLISGSYMIFYRVTGKDVFIDRVLYGRRDYL
ncbi:type II toxin-antitoxin system RelE/ParE family toxin, partial [Intestinimonas butyriciproducens]